MRIIIKIVPLIMLGGLAATAVAASPASAAETHVPRGTQGTGNWAGYYAVPANGKGPEGVFTTFTIPKVSCRNSVGPAPMYGSIWAGIGGGAATMNDVQNGKHAWLEQAGVQFICKNKNAQPLYQPFWEIVRPADGDKYGNPYDSQVFIKDVFGHNATVKPGDMISVDVNDVSYHPPAKEFVLGVTVNRDSDHPVYFGKHVYLPKTAYTGRTAEVVTEYPSGALVPSWFLRAYDWTRLHEFGVFPPNSPGAAGMINLGDVHYAQSFYLTHLPGDVKPEGVAITQYKLIMETRIGRHQVYIYPGRAHSTIPGNPAKDGFSTHYYIP